MKTTRAAPPLTALLIAGLVLVPAVPAGAQEAAPPMPDDPRAPRFSEVERGLFTGFEAGYLTLFKTKNADPAKYQFAPADGGASSGLLVGASLGYDLTRRFALSAFVMGSDSTASASYGSFSTVAVGGDARYAFFASSDKYGVERFYLYAHGRVGYLVTRPVGLLGDHDTYFALGPGIEYFTRLRHFSVGLQVDLTYLSTASTAGLAIAPTVRYTF